MKSSNKLLISAAVCGLLSMTTHADEHKTDAGKGVECKNSCGATGTTTQKSEADCKHAQAEYAKKKGHTK